MVYGQLHNPPEALVKQIIAVPLPEFTRKSNKTIFTHSGYLPSVQTVVTRLGLLLGGYLPE